MNIQTSRYEPLIRERLAELGDGAEATPMPPIETDDPGMDAFLLSNGRDRARVLVVHARANTFIVDRLERLAEGRATLPRAIAFDREIEWIEVDAEAFIRANVDELERRLAAWRVFDVFDRTGRSILSDVANANEETRSLIEMRRAALGADATAQLLSGPDEIALDCVLLSRGKEHRVLLVQPMTSTWIDYTRLEPDEIVAQSDDDAAVKWLEIKAERFVAKLRDRFERTAKAYRADADEVAALSDELRRPGEN